MFHVLDIMRFFILNLYFTLSYVFIVINSIACSWKIHVSNIIRQRNSLANIVRFHLLKFYFTEH